MIGGHLAFSFDSGQHLKQFLRADASIWFSLSSVGFQGQFVCSRLLPDVVEDDLVAV
jgi:hypothetical protein